MIDMYADMDGDNIRCLILRYHTGVHIFSAENNFDILTVTEKISEINPSMICCVKETMDKIKGYFNNYEVTYGNILTLNKVNENIKPLGRPAKLEDLNEVSKLLCSDSGIGSAFEEGQLIERYTQKFGRNYLLAEDGILMSHCATSAELEDIAIISGVITNPKYRGKGYAAGVLANLCRALLSERKRVYSFCYIPPAMRMHEKVGFMKCNDWAKLTKIK